MHRCREGVRENTPFIQNKHFIINTVYKLGMEWTQLSKIKVPCGSPWLTSDSTLKSWEFLFWDQRQDKEAHSPHSCETLTDRLRQSCQTRKRDKGVQTGKREIKLSTDDTIWYIKTLKTQKKILKTRKQFSNVAAYKVTSQDSVAFLQTKYERSGKKIKKVTPFTTAPNTRDHDQGGERSGHWKV